MISVIVPVYGVEQWLPNCVASVLAQTDPDFELILVDDGSPDHCGALCDSFAAQDSRIRVLHQKNGGLSAARNAGLALAKGDYFTFLDSDDCVSPHYLEMLRSGIESCGAEVSVCHFRELENSNVFPDEPYEAPVWQVLDNRQAARLVVEKSERFAITAWGKLYAARLRPWLRYPVGKLHEDEFVTYQVLYLAEKTAVTDAVGYGYLKRSGSIMASFNRRRCRDTLEAMAENIAFFRTRHDDEMLIFAQKRYLRRVCGMYYTLFYEKGNREDKRYLRREFLSFFFKNTAGALGPGSMAERLSFLIFLVWPAAYCLLAKLYLKQNPLS